MKNYSFEKESVKHPYQYYGDVKEEKHGEGTFLLKRALLYVIDDYDAAIGSVEQSHYAELGYYEVTNFSFDEAPETLDLTWMDKEDTFVLDTSEQYKEVKALRTNIDNVYCSYLPIDHTNEPILVIVNHGDTKLSVVRQVRAFQRFLFNNIGYISQVKLEGFNPIVEALLERYAKRCGIETVKEKGLSK